MFCIVEKKIGDYCVFDVSATEGPTPMEERLRRLRESSVVESSQKRVVRRSSQKRSLVVSPPG